MAAKHPDEAQDKALIKKEVSKRLGKGGRSMCKGR